MTTVCLRFLSEKMERKMVAGPSTWHFTGRDYQRTAIKVADAIEEVIARDVGLRGRFGAIRLPGEHDGEPAVGLVIACSADPTPAAMALAESFIAEKTDRNLELNRSDVRLPAPVVS